MQTNKQMGPPIQVQMPDGTIIGVQAWELKDAIGMGGIVITDPNAVSIGQLQEPGSISVQRTPPGGGTMGDIARTPQV